MIVVPDASVLWKWVLEQDDEPNHHQAMNLQQAILDEKIELRLPTLWRFEIGNVLGLQQPRLAAELLKALLVFEFEEEPLSSDYAVDALAHMQKAGRVTFYDSVYHVLALRTQGLYLTADSAYDKRAQSKRHLMLLSDWEGP